MIEVADKRCRRIWRQVLAKEYDGTSGKPSSPGPWQRVKPLDPPLDGISCEGVYFAGASQPLVRLRVFLPEKDAPVLSIEAESDPAGPLKGMIFLEPFILDTPRGALAISYQSNGHLYPLDADPFPLALAETGRLDMPWVGLADPDSGAACMTVFDTPDDGLVNPNPSGSASGASSCPDCTGWERSRSSDRPQIDPALFRQGGHVAMAKAYRERARNRGILVTLAEKAKANPNVARLYGAVDVWILARLRQGSQSAGIEKILFHSPGPPGS